VLGGGGEGLVVRQLGQHRPAASDHL
jgi:hypothetical protein